MTKETTTMDIEQLTIKQAREPRSRSWSRAS